MKKKLREILLIDDYDADNYIHKRIIKMADVAEKITITTGAREALDYLTNQNEGSYPKPEIVFLDINMPGMSGWDFLEEYAKLEDEKKAGIIVCMLSTSMAEKDKERASKIDELSDYINKPLDQTALMTLIERHFPEYL